ncbi:MAG TPA: carboxypeptidase-like regulatory domain-containing protein, partial [Thermoanaerobaculia bacterium]|nr:carboxypeptidase-like regulatory domain-containing protein [Thermoanaerobaculia bacterium]
MKASPRAALFALVIALSHEAALHASGQGRVIGTVEDEAKMPIEGVKVTLTRPGYDYRLDKVTNKEGQFMMLVLDASQH